MKVAVIDNGIARGLLKCPVEYYTVQDGEVIRDNDSVTAYSHGSRCAAMIVRGIPDTEVVSIAIHSEFSTGTEEDLLTALAWCLDHPVDLINLSNGMTSFFQNEAINEVCYRLWTHGTLLVAAVSNDWRYTVPANLPYVRSVTRFPLLSFRANNPFIRADKRICGLTVVRKRNGGLHITDGNSFACAKEARRLLKEMRRGKKPSPTVSRYLIDFSLLKHTVIWGGYQLHPTPPVCMETQEESVDFQDKGITLVIADPDESDILSRLKKKGNTVSSVIWCGRKAPRTVRNWCRDRKIMLWEEPRQVGRTMRSSRRLAALQDCFVVGISSERGALEDALALKKTLEEKAYRVALFSDVAKSYLYGAFPFADQRNILRACAVINPDLILITHEKKAQPVCDLRITFCSETVRLETEDGAADQEFPLYGDIYSRIVEWMEVINCE